MITAMLLSALGIGILIPILFICFVGPTILLLYLYDKIVPERFKTGFFD